MKTQEYVTRDDDGDVVSSIQVHRVDLDKDAPRDDNGNKRPLRVTTTSGDVEVQDGVILARNSEGASFWDVLTEDQFNESGYAPADESAAPVADVKPEPEPEPSPDVDPAAVPDHADDAPPVQE